jgi:ATP-dependent DNA helicase RecQ
VEAIAQVLQVRINAVPYHADWTQKHEQDMDIISYGGCRWLRYFWDGIDKPDVRFVIHHDIPKSLESYYQKQVVPEEVVERTLSCLLFL